ncbi:helix-turn-helix transcriptional regulator [Isosphaeraceae bacterium EP7]
MAIPLGKTARNLRETVGLTQRAMAEELGISAVHLCNIEKNKSVPSQDILDRYRALWGVDLYVLAWCLHGDIGSLPESLRAAAAAIAEGWQKELGVKLKKIRAGPD